MNRSMKQMLSTLLVVAMMAAMLVVPSAAADKLVNGAYKLAMDTTAVTVKEGAKVEKAVKLTYTVTGDTTVYDVTDDTYAITADTSNDKVATAKVANGKVTITGVKAGDAKVTVKVAQLGLEATVAVTVKADAPVVAKTMTEGTYVLDSTKLFNATADNADWRAAAPQGDTGSKANRWDITHNTQFVVDEVFTLYAKTSISGSGKGYMEKDAKTFDDGYQADYCINFGDKTKFLGAEKMTPGDTPNAAIKFTTDAKATVKVWWRGAGDSTRTVGIIVPDMTANTDEDSIGAKALQEGVDSTAASVLRVETFELAEAGTYYVGNVRNTNRIYKVEVTVAKAGSQPSEKPPVEDPELTVYTIKADAEVTVNVNATKKINVTTEPAGGQVYLVSADAKVVKAIVSNNTLTLTGVKAGSAKVVLGVKGGEGTAEVAVTVKSSTTPPATNGGRPVNGTTTDKTDASGNTAKKTTDKNGNVTITVTNKDGEVVAKVEIPAVIPALAKKFKDVPEGHWAEKSINDLAALGLVKGVADETYDMVSPVTRGSLATILFRLAQAKGATSDFTDVAADAWYADAVGWAAKVGIIAGKGDGTFSADESITREQLALMLYRFANLLGLDTRATGAVTDFADGANVSSWAKEAMTWAVGAGILQGNTANELKPVDAASRAETACMVDRFIGLLK